MAMPAWTSFSSTRLAARLNACCEALLAVEARSANAIFGSPDDLKLRSSATLFERVAPPGSVFFCENGEASWRDMAAAIGKAIGQTEEPEPLSLEDSLRAFGIGAVTSFGSNSRVSAEKARRMLGWKPSAATISADLEADYYSTL